MNNVTIDVNRGVAVITVDLNQKGRPSSTGKTEIIASTEGNKPVSDDVKFKDFRIGLNIFRYTAPKAAK